MEPVVPSGGWGVTHLYFRVHPSRSPDPAQTGKELMAALEAFASERDHQVLSASVLGLKADLGVMAITGDLVILAGRGMGAPSQRTGRSITARELRLSLARAHRAALGPRTTGKLRITAASDGQPTVQISNRFREFAQVTQ